MSVQYPSDQPPFEHDVLWRQNARDSDFETKQRGRIHAASHTDRRVYESGVTATGLASVRKLRERHNKRAQVRAHHGRDGVLVFLVQLREQYLTKRRGAALLLCAYY